MEEKKLTGYPSIDKPWQSYFKEELFKDDYPNCSVYDYVFNMNRNRLESIAIDRGVKKNVDKGKRTYRLSIRR